MRHIERNSLLLFMVPADSDDIRKEYEVLLNELRTFNPDMLDKQRVLAVTKSDMLDQELMDELEPTLPEGIPHAVSYTHLVFTEGMEDGGNQRHPV